MENARARCRRSGPAGPAGPGDTGPVTSVTIEGLLTGLDDRLAALPAEQAHLGTFLGTYRRTTGAVGAAVAGGVFEDAGWVVRWTEAFAATTPMRTTPTSTAGLSRGPGG